MASKLERAVEIYRSLGYEETTYENILSLGIGTKEEQGIARDGLKSGEWVQIKQLSENTYGFAPVVDVDLKKLAVFAIRVGVEAKRAANILSRGDEIVLQAIMARGESYAQNFVLAACTSNRRAWEHSLSVLGMLALKLVHKMNLPLPESVEYMKDWSATSAILFGREKKDYNFDESFVLEKEEVLRRFLEHIELGISLGIAATGPFSKVLLWGAENQLFSTEAAKNYIFEALQIAKRPGDRKAWLEILDIIGWTEEEIVSDAENLIPLLGLGESPVLERFAPILIEKVTEELLSPVLISCTSAKGNKVKKLILNSVLKREKPNAEEDYAEWLSLYLQDEDKSIVNLAGKVGKSWGMSPEKEECKKELRSLWRKTPTLWEVPRFSLGNVSSESLTDLAAVLSERKECVEDIVFERFIAMTNQIAYQNPEEARMSLVGIPNGDSGTLWTLGKWARGIEIKPVEESRQRFWQGEKEIVKIQYRDLLTMRREFLFHTMGKWPCLLSTPSYEDLSICPEDLVERLSLYRAENILYVSEPDLQLALTRLNLKNLTEEELQKYRETLQKIDLKILLPSGELLKDEEEREVLLGAILSGYLQDSYVEPAFTPGETPYWRIELKQPESLRLLPDRFSDGYAKLFSIFPNWGDFALTAVHRDSEVYHGQGIILRQIARRRKPLSKGALMNWIAVFGNLSDENAGDALKANQEAWERGLLLPSFADITYLDWRGKDLSNLANLASSMEYMANEGMLSLLWKPACDCVELSLKAPRMLAGTAEIVKFLRDYLDEVIFAVENHLAPAELLDMPAIKNLAGKSGSSRAVSYAKEILEKRDIARFASDTRYELKSPNQLSGKESDKKALPQPPVDFGKVWLPLPLEKELLADHVSFRVKAIELRKNEKVFQFDLDLPNDPDCSYRVIISGWFYGIRQEGQVSAFPVNHQGEILNEEEKGLWLHYDRDKGKIVVSPFRNWRGNNNGPLEGGATPYSKIFLTMAVALLAQDGESIYGANNMFKDLIRSGTVSLETVREITRELLACEDISPAKLLRILEKDSEVLSLCWGMLWECLRHAGDLTEKAGKPPVWINRILDICIYYGAYLREAMERGYISKEDARWPGLLDIANCGAKSTAVKKAKELAEILGIG